MRLTYVTGPTCSGKTTLHQHLVALGQDHVRELDDVSVGGCQPPTAAHTEWLRWRAQEFLTSATRRVTDEPERRGEHHVVTGIVWPFHVLDSNAWDAASDAGVTVRFVLLDRPWDDVERSTIKRLGHEGENWAPDEVGAQLVINKIQARSLHRQVMATGYLSTVAGGGDLMNAARLVAPGASW